MDYLTDLVARHTRGDGYATRNLGLLAWEAFHDPWEEPPEHIGWQAMEDHPGLTLLEVLEETEAYGF